MNKKILPNYENQTPLVVLELIQSHRIKDIMSSDIICVEKDVSMSEVKQLMKENGISGIPVTSKKRLVGIVSLELSYEELNTFSTGSLRLPASARGPGWACLFPGQ
jgi:predicted transcriptional regulator